MGFSEVSIERTYTTIVKYDTTLYFTYRYMYVMYKSDIKYIFEFKMQILRWY